MVIEEASSSSSWSREQDDAFENALAAYSQDSSNWWEKVAAAVPGKTIEEVKHHYELLVEDIDSIESGRVPLPNYVSPLEGSEDDSESGRRGWRSNHERRKGVAWTEEEHRLFLLGLDKFGKGDWRSISRNFVVSRTPTQVASHAQKYFIRMNANNKDRRRSSIHDITSVGNGDVLASEVSIARQTNGTSMTSGKLMKQTSEFEAGSLGVSSYGSMSGHLISSVGTHVTVSVQPSLHVTYSVQNPVAGAIVPGSRMNLASTRYPLSSKSIHR